MVVVFIQATVLLSDFGFLALVLLAVERMRNCIRYPRSTNRMEAGSDPRTKGKSM